MDFNNKKATRKSYGESLVELGKVDDRIVVLDADLSSTTNSGKFGEVFPKRFFNMGIAEQDLLGTAAGFATCGNIPFASTFAMFATGRSYDQIRNSICYPDLNVKVCATHSGLSAGPDGATHQMVEDISLMRGLPNMVVLNPSDDVQTKWIMREAVKIDGPVYVRLSRYDVPQIYDETSKFEFGKGYTHGYGKSATIFSTGIMVSECLMVKDKLEKEGINVRVVDIHTIKPIDKELIIKSAKETNHIVAVENHSIIGGLGSAICEVLSENYPAKVSRIGMNDTFGKSGKIEELLEEFNLDANGIYTQIKDILNKD